MIEATPVYSPGWRSGRLREGLLVWGLSFFVLMAARYLVGPLIPFIADNLKAISIIVFLYVPAWMIRRRGESFSDYGLSLKNWRKDLLLALGTAALIFPLFALAFVLFVFSIEHLPFDWALHLSPYSAGFRFAFRLPEGILYLLLIHLVIVAFPEEFFYRGWLYARFSEGLNEEKRGKRFLGVVIGPAFWTTALLFALGHLTEPYAWRLGVFFPALVFAWLRLRSGGLVAPIVFHALSNVYISVLEASFFGP